MGSVRHIAHRVPRVTSICIAGAAVAITGIAITITGTAVTIIDHVAFVRCDYHPVVIRSKGPNKRIHVILHPPRQIATDGLGHWGNDDVKVKVGIGVLKVAEDTGECTPEQAATPLFDELASPLRAVLQSVTTSVKNWRLPA